MVRKATPNLAERLRSEAEFQNERVQRAAAGEAEARDSFYYLADSAKRCYEQAIERVAGQVVLVVGCSEGGVAPLVRRGARHVDGIDIAADAIIRHAERLQAEGLAERARLQVMNGEALTFPSNSFDLICCTGVLHHLDVAKAAESWSRCLRHHGRAVVLEPMAWHPAIALYRLLTPSMRTPDEHPLTPRHIRQLRERFGHVEIKAFVLFSILSMAFGSSAQLRNLRESVHAALERIDRILLRVMPFLSYFCWTAVLVLEEPRPVEASSSPIKQD